jgi:hypothetical protein
MLDIHPYQAGDPGVGAHYQTESNTQGAEAAWLSGLELPGLVFLSSDWPCT